MLDINWLLFLPATLAVIVSPGQDLLLILSRGLGQGPKSGIISAAGVACGLIGHTLLAAVGLGALLTSSELAFDILKYIGAAYLLYIGIRSLLQKHTYLSLSTTIDASPAKTFYLGVLSNISNPKVTLFYFAFLPQFIQSNAVHPTISMIVLGLSYAVLTFVLKAPLGYFAGRLSHYIQRRPEFLNYIFKVSGIAFILLAIRLVFEEVPNPS